MGAILQLKKTICWIAQVVSIGKEKLRIEVSDGERHSIVRRSCICTYAYAGTQDANGNEKAQKNTIAITPE